MPDKDGNLTQREIDVLKFELERLNNLDQAFKNLESIGQDVSQDRKERDENVIEIKRMLKVYEPLVKE